MDPQNESIERETLLKHLSDHPYAPATRKSNNKKYLLLAALAALAIYLVSTNYDLDDLLRCKKPAHRDQDLWTSPGWYPTPRAGTVKSWESAHARAAELVSRMTLTEKVNITSGTGWEQGLCLGNTAPAPRLDFPSLCLQDGPLGLRFADNATAWPAALTAGATWNRKLMYARGAGHGQEAKGKGVNVILGPSMGPLGRAPAGGRNWEGFGTDPYLQGVASAETIRGIQDQGVIATAKHFLLNEQEHFRQIREWEGSEEAISSNVDERTMRELYLWPFMDSVRAGVGSVMCSYNQINNSYGCGNAYMMNAVLKDELGFQGFVQSDWWAAHSGAWAALSGLDVMMPGTIQQTSNPTPGASYFGANLTLAVLNGTVPLERIDDMAARVVAAWYQMEQDDKTKFPEDEPNFSSWTYDKEDYLYHGAGSGPRGVVNKFIDVQGDHYRIARQVAIEGTVLTKNLHSALPLSASSLAGKKVGIFGADAGDDEEEGFPNFCKDRGCNKGSLGSGWGSGAVDFPHFHTPQASIRRALKDSEITAITDNKKLDAISAAAAEQDVCIAFLNSDAGEGYIKDPLTGVHGDRLDLSPQLGGTAVVLATAKHCKNTIVVLHAVGPTLIEEFADHPNVTAILLAHLPGQESGEALASILFGASNPSGKLPYTLGKSLAAYGPHAGILEHSKSDPPQQTFHEKLEVDYRYFDAHDVTPRYEFGFGLSYTTFALSGLRAELVRKKTEWPAPRKAGLTPPVITSEIPDEEDVLFPEGFEKIKDRVYPYLDSVPAKGEVVRPEDYDVERELSPAGGGEGGNPSLWEVIAEVKVTVKNTGERAGAEVVQAYVGFPEVEGESFPVRVLRGFEKVELEKGESKEVVLGLTRRDLSYYDVKQGNWRLPEGKHTVWVGRSSRDFVGSVEL